MGTAQRTGGRWTPDDEKRSSLASAYLAILCSRNVCVCLQFSGGVSEAGLVDVAVDVAVDHVGGRGGVHAGPVGRRRRSAVLAAGRGPWCRRPRRVVRRR